MGWKIAIWLVVVAAGLGALYLAGPKVPVDTTIRFNPSRIGPDPDAYLAAEEAAVPGIRPGLQKEIVWADPATKARTPLAIVYIHGFSASKAEVRPLPDFVAKALGANLFYTRLTGHGRDGAAMAEGSVNAWVNDMAEALAIGHRIGDRVVVIATSTGGSLAAWAACNPALADQIDALALISPNFGLRAAGSFILGMHWGGAIAELVVGKERGFEPENALHAKYWTTRYPTRALLPMKALVDLARSQPVEKTTVPAFFIFDPDDQVVDERQTIRIAGRWGGPHRSKEVRDDTNPSHHVIAGDILSPPTTRPLADAIITWIDALPH